MEGEACAGRRSRKNNSAQVEFRQTDILQRAHGHTAVPAHADLANSQTQTTKDTALCIGFIDLIAPTPKHSLEGEIIIFLG